MDVAASVLCAFCREYGAEMAGAGVVLHSSAEASRQVRHLSRTAAGLPSGLSRGVASEWRDSHVEFEQEAFRDYRGFLDDYPDVGVPFLADVVRVLKRQREKYRGEMISRHGVRLPGGAVESFPHTVEAFAARPDEGWIKIMGEVTGRLNGDIQAVLSRRLELSGEGFAESLPEGFWRVEVPGVDGLPTVEATPTGADSAGGGGDGGGEFRADDECRADLVRRRLAMQRAGYSPAVISRWERENFKNRLIKGDYLPLKDGDFSTSVGAIRKTLRSPKAAEGKK